MPSLGIANPFIGLYITIIIFSKAVITLSLDIDTLRDAFRDSIVSRNWGNRDPRIEELNSSHGLGDCAFPPSSFMFTLATAKDIHIALLRQDGANLIMPARDCLMSRFSILCLDKECSDSCGRLGIVSCVYRDEIKSFNETTLLKHELMNLALEEVDHVMYVEAYTMMFANPWPSILFKHGHSNNKKGVVETKDYDFLYQRERKTVHDCSGSASTHIMYMRKSAKTAIYYENLRKSFGSNLYVDRIAENLYITQSLEAAGRKSCAFPSDVFIGKCSDRMMELNMAQTWIPRMAIFNPLCPWKNQEQHHGKLKTAFELFFNIYRLNLTQPVSLAPVREKVARMVQVNAEHNRLFHESNKDCVVPPSSVMFTIASKNVLHYIDYQRMSMKLWGEENYRCLDEHFLVICMDRACMDYCESHDVSHYVYTSHIQVRAEGFDALRDLYNFICFSKLPIIREMLQVVQEVIYFDSDVMLFRNPWVHIGYDRDVRGNQLSTKRFDFQYQAEHVKVKHCNILNHQSVNGGQLYFRNTSRFYTFYDYIRLNYTDILRGRQLEQEFVALAAIYAKMSSCVLPPDLYVGFCTYIFGHMEHIKRETPVKQIISYHPNCIAVDKIKSLNRTIYRIKNTKMKIKELFHDDDKK